MFFVYGCGNVKLDKDIMYMVFKSIRMVYKEICDVSRILYNL